jgi:hypothetical protein
LIGFRIKLQELDPFRLLRPVLTAIENLQIFFIFILGLKGDLTALQKKGPHEKVL